MSYYTVMRTNKCHDGIYGNISVISGLQYCEVVQYASYVLCYNMYLCPNDTICFKSLCDGTTN